jgi:hypothetical protein
MIEEVTSLETRLLPVSEYTSYPFMYESIDCRVKCQNLYAPFLDGLDRLVRSMMPFV